MMPQFATRARNASLELTKFPLDRAHASFTSADNKPYLQAATRCVPSEAYRKAYDRWVEQIHALDGTTLAATFAVEGRLAVGVGAENVLESSIATNRLWGMPLIPGSALKGLASHYTTSTMAEQGGITVEQHVDLFGSPEWSACLTWLDAWYVPDSEESPFALDVVTGHHRSYYQRPGEAPVDFEDPIPSYSVTARGTFLVAVQAPDAEWAVAAMNLLRHALELWGVGAKTGSIGYGQLQFIAYASPWMLQRLAAEQAEATAAADEASISAEYLRLIDELQDTTVNPSTRAAHWVSVWASTDNQQKTHLGRQILERLQQSAKTYHRITGRVIAGYSKAPADPKAYIRPLLEWMDEHAPEGSER